MLIRQVLLAAACAAVVGVAPAAAQSVVVEFTGTEVFLPEGPGFPERVNGKINCHGQVEPTGSFTEPCGVGVPGSIRGRVIYALESIASPSIHGVSRIVVNMNFDANGDGPMWGTFELAVLEGGALEGTYSGKANLYTHTMNLKVVGHGEGGGVDGLKFMFDDVHDASPFGTLQGRILNPGGK